MVVGPLSSSSSMARRWTTRDIDLHTLADLMRTDRLRDRAWRGPKVIAFLAANPVGTHALRLGDEWAEIARELKLAPYRDDFRFESRWAVTIDDLIRHLNELDPTIIHLSAHGGSGTLILQDEAGGPEPVSPDALAAIVGSAARNPRVALLNGCSTIAHADALCATVDVVVSMRGEISDAGARMFASRFYGALGNRRTVGNAVRQGRAKLLAKRLPDEALPDYVTREGIDADLLIV